MAAYNPGTADTSTIRQTGETSFVIDSFRGEAKNYQITLGPHPSCSCPHFQTRLKDLPGSFCKHIQAVEEFVKAEQQARAGRYRELELKAGSVDDETLPKLIEKYRQSPGPVLCALLGELHDREQLPGQPLPVFPALDLVLANARTWGRKQREAKSLSAPCTNALDNARLRKYAEMAEADRKSIFA